MKTNPALVRKRRRTATVAQLTQGMTVAAPAGGTLMSKKNKKLWTKRHKLGKGDIVRYFSGIQNYMGSIGTVVGYLDKNTVLVKNFGGNDTDVPAMYLGVDVRQWDQNAWEQNPRGKNPYYRHFVIQVVTRKNPRPKKERKVHVIESHEDMVAALTGKVEVAGHHVVVALERGLEKVTEAQEAQQEAQ